MNRILIISSSSRALADSADRAGFSFDVYDRFHDWDLQRICQRKPENQNIILRATDFKSLVESVDGARYCGAVIGGGFENRLTELEFLDTRITRFGPSIEALRRLQTTESLDWLSNCILNAGGKWPTTLAGSDAHFELLRSKSRIDTNWLLKDLRGSGGSHVRPVANDIPGITSSYSNYSSSMIFQEQISGQSISALYLSVSRRSNQRCQSQSTDYCQLIGCTEQLVGVKEFGASEFSYCGSVGPIFMDNEQRQIITRIGRNIAEQFSIVGIFGIDFIVNDEGFWPVDINPRITASAELFEIHRQLNDLPHFSFFATHIDACSGSIQPIETISTGLALAKGILFCQAKSGLKVTPEIFDCLVSLAELQTTCSQQPNHPSFFIADVPDCNTFITYGAPILTLFETGATPQDAKMKLFDSAKSLMIGL